MSEFESEIRGTLTLRSETGTEGGYWAIQDGRFISYVIPDNGLFQGQSVVDPQDRVRTGKVASAMNEDGTRYTSMISGAKTVIDLVVEWDDGEQDLRKSDTVLTPQWSYDGLVMLRSGDELTVYEKLMPERIAWHGLVELVRHDEDTIGPTLMHPFRLHHDQAGVDQNEWAGWFLHEYPAKLNRLDGFDHVVRAIERERRRKDNPNSWRRRKDS